MGQLYRPRIRKGFYRLVLPGIGECARVHPDAGDAYPYLERDMYEALGFSPSFDQLALQTDADRQRDHEPWRR